MKKVLSYGFAFSLILMLAACYSPSTESTVQKEVVEIAKDQIASVDLKVEGMVCAMGCAKFIEDKVAEMEGVTLSTVNFEEGLAHFEFDKSKLSEDDLAKYINEIHDGQYKATLVEDLQKAEENETEEESVSANSNEEIGAIHRFHFSIPDLVGYFLKSLR